MRVGILGSGLMGGKLGTLWARAGHEVVFSYARSEQKLKRLAREAQRNAKAGTPAALSSDDPKRAGLYNHSARSSYRSPPSLGVDC
jgi:predicted dinucleotide-binding enzyme